MSKTNDNNYYSILEDDLEADLISCVGVSATVPKKLHVPMLVIKKSTHDKVLSLLQCENITQFKIKLMSIGIKVVFDSADDRT